MKSAGYFLKVLAVSMLLSGMVSGAAFAKTLRSLALSIDLEIQIGVGEKTVEKRRKALRFPAFCCGQKCGRFCGFSTGKRAFHFSTCPKKFSTWKCGKRK